MNPTKQAPPSPSEVGRRLRKHNLRLYNNLQKELLAEQLPDIPKRSWLRCAAYGRSYRNP